MLVSYHAFPYDLSLLVIPVLLVVNYAIETSSLHRYRNRALIPPVGLLFTRFTCCCGSGWITSICLLRSCCCGRGELRGRFHGARERPASLRKRAQIGSMLALVAAASMWFYVDRILVGFQVADAAARERPRGNLSDLYPRWLGARELLLRNRNPYGDDITIEIQKGYYGRALDPARPNDPKDQQGFAYPVYVVFLLAPFVRFSFHAVQFVFYWALIALTAISVCLWLRALRWRLPAPATASWCPLTLGKFCRSESSYSS